MRTVLFRLLMLISVLSTPCCLGAELAPEAAPSSIQSRCLRYCESINVYEAALCGSLSAAAWSTAANTLAASTLACGCAPEVQGTIALSNAIGGCLAGAPLGCATQRDWFGICRPNHRDVCSDLGFSALLLPLVSQGLGYGVLLLIGPWSVAGFPLPFWYLSGISTGYASLGIASAVVARYGLDTLNEQEVQQASVVDLQSQSLSEQNIESL